LFGELLLRNVVMRSQVLTKVFTRLGLIGIWQRSLSKYALNSKHLGNIPRNGKKIFQLVGLPRSGTTLLASIIDNHPNAVCLIEPYLSWIRRGVFDINLPGDGEILSGYKIQHPDRYIEYLCSNTMLHVIGFKETYRTQNHPIPTASFLMKNARFRYVDDTIVIVRDPRDAWVSALTRSENTFLSFADLEEYVCALKGLLDWIIKDHLFVLRYEDLVLEPCLVKDVIDKLGLSFQKSILKLREKEGFGDIRAQSGGPIFSSSIGRYKEYLESDLLGYIEDNSTEYLTYFGYPS
jgi:hypothetical protein